MRQLIARIDDELHRRLKARARAEGRSLNALVTDALRAALAPDDDRQAVMARMEAAGWRVTPPLPAHVPSDDEIEAATRGAGSAVSDALAAEREYR